MADWVTISALSTGGATLVLAGATFASVRSASRAARVGERSLLAALRPLLVPEPEAPSETAFRRLTRDLYVAPGDVGFWQGAVRDPNDPEFAAAREAIEARKRLTVDVLYGDYEGGQLVISRFAYWPREDGRWIAGVARHLNLDRSDPR